MTRGNAKRVFISYVSEREQVTLIINEDFLNLSTVTAAIFQSEICSSCMFRIRILYVIHCTKSAIF